MISGKLNLLLSGRPDPADRRRLCSSHKMDFFLSNDGGRRCSSNDVRCLSNPLGVDSITVVLLW